MIYTPLGVIKEDLAERGLYYGRNYQIIPYPKQCSTIANYVRFSSSNLKKQVADYLFCIGVLF